MLWYICAITYSCSGNESWELIWSVKLPNDYPSGRELIAQERLSLNLVLSSWIRLSFLMLLMFFPKGQTFPSFLGVSRLSINAARPIPKSGWPSYPYSGSFLTFTWKRFRESENFHIGRRKCKPLNSDQDATFMLEGEMSEPRGKP